MKKSNFKNTDKTSSGFLLWQVTTLWQREIKSALEKVELSHSAFVILASLLWFKEKKQTVTQTTIIDHSKLDKMTVSKSLKTLQNNSLVQRSENKEDTRSKIIVLTKEGESLAKNAIKMVEEIDHKFFSPLETSEKNQLNELFLKLKDT